MPSVYSRYAKNRDDVGTATVLGFLGVFCLLILVTILSYETMLRADLATLATPSMAGVMEAIAHFRVGQLPVLVAARGGGAAFARENANKVPAAALCLTNIVIQVFLIVAWFADYAFTLALKMTSSMTLIPYLLVAAYGLKLAWGGETY